MIALTTDSEIWPTSPLIFTEGVKKCKILAFEALWFRNEATCRLSFSKFQRFHDGPLTSPNFGINRFAQLGETGCANLYKCTP